MQCGKNIVSTFIYIKEHGVKRAEEELAKYRNAQETLIDCHNDYYEALDEVLKLIKGELESSNNEFKDLYKRAIINAKKPKTELNWVHVKNLGVGSTRAFEILRSFNIDPEGTDMRIQQDTQGEN